MTWYLHKAFYKPKGKTTHNNFPAQHAVSIPNSGHKIIILIDLQLWYMFTVKYIFDLQGFVKPWKKISFSVTIITKSKEPCA